MISVGIDYSIRSPAVCILTDKKTHFYFYHLKDIVYEDDNYKVQSFVVPHIGLEPSIAVADINSNFVLEVIKPFTPNNIFIEGYSYGSSVGRAYDIAENGAILKYKLISAGLSYILVSPKTVKKQATGKGNADKQEMYNNFIKHNPKLDLKQILKTRSAKTNPLCDIVDSYFIASINKNI